MKYLLRQEKVSDHAEVESLIKEAFADVELSDHREHDLVTRLRKSPSFVPALSIVAESEGKIVGHILFTRIKIEHEDESHEALALAPVSVLPDHQGRGIGAALIKEGHKVAQRLGFKASVLLGHETYYPRFGYERASTFGISLPFEVPDENVMAFALQEGALIHMRGTVEYDAAFFAG